MKKRFTIGGAVAGVLCGSSIVVNAFIKGPGLPGSLELVFMAIFIGGFVVLGSLLGLLTGWLVSLCITKK